MGTKLFFLLAAVIVSAPLNAQMVPPSGMPTAAPGGQDPREMWPAYEAAQAAASRPGDEKLGCEELQAQLAQATNDSTIQANVEAAGAAAERDMAAIAAAKRAYDAQLAGSVAGSAAASAAPGGQWAAFGAAAAQAEASKATGAGRMQQRAAQAGRAMQMMPQLLRGQRLLELAAAKDCEWAASIDLNAGSQP